MKRASAARLPVLALPLVLALGAAPARGQLQAGSAPLIEQVEVNVVNVDVHVTDSSGQPVPGLGKQDFELYEDGKPVKLTNFEAVAGERTAGPTPSSPAAPHARPGKAAASLSEEQRLHLVIYIDNFNLQPAHRARVLKSLRTFIEEQLAPTDRVLLVTYDLGVHVRLPFTSDRAAITAALERSLSLAGGNDLDSQRRAAMRDVIAIHDARLKRGDPCDAQIEHPVAGYADSTRQEVLRSIRGLTLLVNSLAGVPGHKALLHVSDGLQLTPGQDLYEFLNQLCGGVANGLPETTDGTLSAASGEGYDTNHAAIDAQHYSTADDFRKLTNHANAQGVPFYTLQASGLQGTSTAGAEYDTGERALELPVIDTIHRANLRDSLSFMASETGGKTIFDANDPTADLARVRADFDTYYSLGFSPQHNGDAKEHRIEVRVKRRGLRLRYRQGYRDEPILERAVNRTLATLLHGFEDNPIDVTLTVAEATPVIGATPAVLNAATKPAAADLWQVPVRLRIPLFKLAILNHDEVFDGRLRLLVLTRDGADHISPVRQVEVPIHVPKAQVLTALGQYFAYDLDLQLPPGSHRLAVAVRDEYGNTTSYLGKDLEVGGSARPVEAVH